MRLALERAGALALRYRGRAKRQSRQRTYILSSYKIVYDRETKTANVLETTQYAEEDGASVEWKPTTTLRNVTRVFEDELRTTNEGVREPVQGLLLRIDTLTYVHVDAEGLAQFNADAPIEKLFCSIPGSVHGSGVVDHYAVDEKGTVYMLSAGVIVPSNVFHKVVDGNPILRALMPHGPTHSNTSYDDTMSRLHTLLLSDHHARILDDTLTSMPVAAPPGTSFVEEVELFQNGEFTKHRTNFASVPASDLYLGGLYLRDGSAALTMHPRLRRRHRDSVPPVDESTPVSDNRELLGKLLETVGLRLLNVTTVHQRWY